MPKWAFGWSVGWRVVAPGRDVGWEPYSSWVTKVSPDYGGGGIHQDGSHAHEFRRLGHQGFEGDGGPTPLVQLRIGFALTDTSTSGCEQLY